MHKYLIPIFGILAIITLIGILPSLTKSTYCANSISCIKNLNVDVENNAVGVYEGQKISPPKIDLTADASVTKVLGDQTATGEKHIYVDLSTQTLTAYQGDTLFMTALVSTGKWHATPDGDFTIWTKIRATRMTGGEGADFYNLPNVPYVMFFSNSEVPAGAGFSLHGAYWHNNFGHAMSHGCVNMRIVDAQKLFNWVEDPSVSSTTVTITGTAI